VADCYYLDAARNQQGPVPPDEVARFIRNGTIRRDTMVWFAGMPDWRAASQVSEFAPLFDQAAPPPRRPGPPPVAPSVQRTGLNAGTYQDVRPVQAAYYQAAYYHAPRSMGFGEAIKTCFRKYADFKGRARRPEYWWWYLFLTLVNIGLTIIDLVIAAAGGPGILSSLGSLALFLPWLAVSVRRLHDTDRSGWWMLLLLLLVIGWIILLVFFCLRGTDGPNRFGSDDSALAAEFD